MSGLEDIIERRPQGATPAKRFPRRWIERHGPPPEGKGELREWIKRNIADEGGTSIRSGLDEGRGIERRSTAAPAAPAASAGPARRKRGSVPAGGATVVMGVGVPFMQQTVIGGVFREQFHPDALNEQQRAGWTSKFGSVMGLWQHDRNQPLASVRGESLTFNVTRSALLYAMAMPESAAGEHVAALVGRGDVDGASVGFVPEVEVWTDENDDMPLVTVMRAELVEQSIVWAPAYGGTTAELKRVKPLTLDERRRQMEARERRFAPLEQDCRRLLAPRPVRVGDRVLWLKSR